MSKISEAFVEGFAKEAAERRLTEAERRKMMERMQGAMRSEYGLGDLAATSLKTGLLGGAGGWMLGGRRSALPSAIGSAGITAAINLPTALSG